MDNVTLANKIAFYNANINYISLVSNLAKNKQINLSNKEAFMKAMETIENQKEEIAEIIEGNSVEEDYYCKDSVSGSKCTPQCDSCKGQQE